MIKVWGKKVSESLFTEYVKGGLSAQQIAERFNISRPTVYKISKEMGLYESLIQNGRVRNREHCRTIIKKIKESMK